MGHNHATAVFASLAENPKSHVLVVKSGLLPLLLVLRNSKDLESRRVSLEALLEFLGNPQTHPLVRDEYDLVQTLAALSKFGVNKHIKERSADIVITLMTNDKKPLPPHLAKQKAM